MQARLQIGDGHINVPRDWIRWADSARRGWSWRGDTLVREFRFRDFDDGMRFLEQVGRRADDRKRHPDISISSNRVLLTIANPHHAGVTLAELRLAAKVNAVIDELGVGGDGLRPR
jgi:pterin-4a-carbinolamine dehydratase